MTVIYTYVILRGRVVSENTHQKKKHTVLLVKGCDFAWNAESRTKNKKKKKSHGSRERRRELQTGLKTYGFRDGIM